MANGKDLSVEQSLIERFGRELDALVGTGTRVGLAVSGGPDSLALLLLAARARPELVEAATVDHALRPESAAEAAFVAELCGRLGVPHQTLTVQWKAKPETAIQERARLARYRLLGSWARERKLTAIASAHHLDDQAETFLMRLARGAGVKGLAGMRRLVRGTPAGVSVIRPLLNWRHAELEAICASAGLSPIDDPSNADEQFERVRMRQALASSDWLDPSAIAASATNLAQADAALHWATDLEWGRAVAVNGGAIVYTPTDAPREIRRRIVRRALMQLASEGGGMEPRGRELDQLLAALRTGRRATLRGVLCIGGPQWRFTRAPARRAPPAALPEAAAVEA
jgi:tRNA(Ile)-lysidine synthase